MESGKIDEMELGSSEEKKRVMGSMCMKKPVELGERVFFMDIFHLPE